MLSPLSLSTDRQEKLWTQFRRYIAISSQSDETADTLPSSPGQMTLAQLLADELRALGLADVKISAQAIVTARLPANHVDHDVPSIGFIAHLDTVDVNLSPDIHPQLIEQYSGGDICLNPDQNIYLRVSEHPEIEQYIGQDIICSDGTSVLGADDKAAITSIMVAIEEMINHDLAHGDVYICFVPDEEIGLLGAKALNLDDFPVDYAYTLDCCELGEVVYETFNAASAVIDIEGVTAHPMSAKGVLINPTQIAVDMVNLLNRLDTPENTSGREGYIWPQAIESNQARAQLSLNIRDHDKAGFAAKKAYVEEMVRLTQMRYPKATITYAIDDNYGNIADAVTDNNRNAIDAIYTAMELLGITPKTLPMRGGTDGSYLSARGILTPNFFTGAHNFHSNCEFLPLPSFDYACLMVITLCRLATESYNNQPDSKEIQ